MAEWMVIIFTRGLRTKRAKIWATMNTMRENFDYLLAVAWWVILKFVVYFAYSFSWSLSMLAEKVT